MIPTVLSGLALAIAAPPGAIDVYLGTELRPADGFSAPRVGLEVRVIGHGEVRRVREGPSGTTVVVEHVYYENLDKRGLVSFYAGLTGVSASEGAKLTRGTALGSASAQVQVGLRERRVSEDWEPRAELKLSDFLSGRERLFVPQEEAVLLVVDQSRYELRRYTRGVLTDRHEIGLGQAKGQKRRQGDLRTPKGMYFVTDKRRGEFSGRYAAYFGGHWIKINYPNPWDAERGVADGLVDTPVVARIRDAWSRRELTDQRTPLGGGIGFHGWSGEWTGEGGAHLSWGCVVLHNPDIAELFDHIPIGAMIIIL